jgi:RNA polymerase Rpb2/RNA polymerase Rpb1
MTAPVPGAPWHKESFDRFIKERLPELLAERASLESYEVESTGAHTCKVTVTIGGASVEIDDIPQPDESGLFQVQNVRRVVLPLASCEELDRAEIRCVGEQLYDFVEPRVDGGADLPLGEWVREFLAGVSAIDGQNYFSRLEHTRRISVDVPRGKQKIGVPGQLGRICPLMMPEGPNIGKIMSVVRGAVIRDGKIIPADGPPEEMLAVTTACIPCAQFDDPNRALMGANMMRQWLVPPEPEPALVQTGFEPDDPAAWCGRNLLTAYVPWGADTFEDAIVISESCAKRLACDAPIEPGDKLSNRHGAKGVISRILPDDQMPHLADGTPAELVYSFMGLPSRMNFGQVREAVLGRVAHATGRPVVAPPFGGPDNAELHAMLADAGLPENGMEQLRLGKDGPPLDRPSTVGYVYWGVTHHLAAGKLRSSPGGAKGNRQSHLEYIALRDLGAYDTILEQYSTRSEDRDGFTDLPVLLAAGEIEQAPPPTPVFAELRTRLAAAGITAELGDGGVRFAMAEAGGDALQLACPVQHPWLDDQDLAAVPSADSATFQALAEANARAEKMLSGSVPETLAARSREALQRAVGRYFHALISREQLRMTGNVTFSGRAVIAPSGDLRIDQAGIPDEIAWPLFAPLVARELGDEKAVSDRTDAAAAKLDEIMARTWVIINRAPSMYPGALLAFRAVRVPDRVIRMHPLACMSMNADFDGDQVAVFLPITQAGQREAAEKLSMAARLDADPDMVRWFSPTLGSMFGLASKSLDPDGREELRAVTGVDVTAEAGIATRDSIRDAIRAVLDRDGAERALELSEQLMRLGFEAAKRSGGSLCAFAGEHFSAPDAPDPLTERNVLDQLEGLKDAVLARRDYDSVELGAQLLSVHSHARSSALQFVTGLICRTVADERRRLVFIPRAGINGLEPEQYFTCCIGARRGLGKVAMECLQMGHELYETHAPRGINVLARAIRARRPGHVLARAAANGEADPLTDPDARLFVGLRPLC